MSAPRGLKSVQLWAEYALARTFLGVFELLPLSVATWVAARVGELIFVVHRSRRRIAIENLLRSGVATSPAHARRIARANFRHFTVLVVESLRGAARVGEPDSPVQVEWDVPESVEDLLADERQGLILASGHLGSWEVAAHVIAQRKPVVGLTRRMNNPHVERLVQARKPSDRFRLTATHDADTGRFFASLKRGEILALLIDQHAPSRGMQVEFFGRPASTHTSVALLHLVTGVPICFGYCERLGPMRYRFHAEEPIRHARSGDKQADVRAILEDLNGRLERAIRAHPEQYMWGHRRWRET